MDGIHVRVSVITLYNASKHASGPTPSFNSRADIDAVRKRVCLTGGDWGYVLLIAIHYRDDLDCRLLER